MAVLYLDNLSRDTADAFLADGLTEEIIIRLGQVPRLEVKSRFEVQRFRGRAPLPDPVTLGRSLNAAYLVTGSVQRAADRVRLRVALVRAATRAQVWGDVIDRASADLLTVESDIARAVATAITGQLLPEERTRLSRPVTVDPGAYEDYLRGLQLANSTFVEAPQREALAFFDRAVQRDSGFAAAWAAAARVWLTLADAFVIPREAYGRAREAAMRALAHDSTLALGYAVLSTVAIALDWDAHEAERLALQAIAVGGWAGDAHGALSQALFAQGRLDESLEEAWRTWLADSLTALNGPWYVLVLSYERRFAEATAFVPRLGTVLAPADIRQIEGTLRAAQGDLAGALKLLNWRYYGGGDAGTVVRGLLAQGDTAAARAIVDSMRAARATGYFNPVPIAKGYAALGDADRGIEWLQRAFEERTVWLIFVRQDPELAPLRADPRYAALDRQLRF